MKEHSEQQLDKLTEKLIGSMKLETPSSNFTNNIMHQLEGLGVTKTSYRPLISKRGWFIVSVVVLIFISYLYFGKAESLGWLDGMNFSINEEYRLSKYLAGITISKPILYTFVSFGILMLVQFTALKNYLDKRLQF